MFKLTEERSYGKERLCRSLCLFVCGLGLIANGDDLKWGSGGSGKGPAIRPNITSVSTFFCAM